MKNYIVQINFDLPYPVTKEYVVLANSFQGAASRAIRDNKPALKKKRINKMTMSILCLGKLMEGNNL